MALGQLGEYAVDGQIKLKNLAKVAGPMAAVTVVALGISKVMGEIAESKAFHKKQVEDWTTALREGKEAAGAILTTLNETGKIEFRFMGDTKDLVPILADAGLSADDFTTAVSGTKEELVEFLAKAKESGVGTDELSQIVFAATQYHHNLEAAVKTSGEQTKVFGDEAKNAAVGADALAAAVKGVKENAKPATHEVDLFAESVANLDQKYSQLTGKLDEEDAWANVNESIANFRTNTDGTAQDVRDLTRDIADYVIETDTIPETKKTEILALLDEGQIAAAELALADLTRTREIYLKLTGPGAQTAAGYGNGISGARAKGGPVSPGGAYLVGEEGPELLQMGSKGGTVIPNGGGPGGGGPTFNLTVNAGMGTDGYAVSKAIVAGLAEYDRRNGTHIVTKVGR